MSHANEKPVPAEQQDTGLQMGTANEVSPDLTPEEIIFSKLDAFWVSRIRHGGYDAPWIVKELAGTLMPDELLLLMANPKNTGLYTEDPQQVRNLMCMAAWRCETHDYCMFKEEIAHYALVRHWGNKAVVMHWNESQLVHQSLPAFKDSQTGRYTSVVDPNTGEHKRKKLADALLESTLLRSYDYAEFLPGQNTPPNTLNLWRGWPYPDMPDDSTDEPIWCDLFLEHMFTNMCGRDEELYQYLLGWLADALQNPNRTARVALVLRGPQGSGKSMFATCVAEFFAPHSAVLARPEQLTGQFNKHLMDKSFVFADEAFAGHKNHAAALKTLVTSDKMLVEPKGVDAFMANKYFRLIIASNDEHVIQAEGDDRRFFVLEVDAGANNNSQEYFAAILEQWKSGGAFALFRWLRGAYWRQKLESGEWSAEKRPKTRALQQQKDLSLPAPEMAVFNMLREGEPPCQFSVEGENIFVPTRFLAESARLSPKDEKSLGDALRVIAAKDENEQPCNVRRTIAGDQHRGFILPPLAQAREKWEKHKSRKVQWPEDVRDWAASIGHIPEGKPGREPF
jgi:hypothetical protein